MEAQFRRRAAELESGARPVGWKVGLNAPPVQQLLGLDTCAVGYLTDATRIVPERGYSLTGGVHVGVEPEIAIAIGCDVPGDGALELELHL